MYSTIVTESQIAKVEKKLKLKLVRYEPGVIADRSQHITKLYAEAKREPTLSAELKAFIKNEQILCKLDFGYFSGNYVKIIRDHGGGIGTLQMWESQLAVMRLIAKIEELCWECLRRKEPVDGILICLNKARQLGATMLLRAIIIHRLLLYSHTRGLSASVDEDKVLELYDRDKRIMDNLPVYLQPANWGTTSGGADKKGEHIHFAKLDSSILYQHGKQQSGLGQGRQFDVSHITEAASFPLPGMLEHDFMPTLPQSVWAFCLMESTPQGRGNWWHEWSEKVRFGQLARWKYLFVPVYIEPLKYRRTPPVNWSPQELTVKRAAHVEATSPRVIGRKFICDREHLYWWETTRQEYMQMGSLSFFLTNYADTPEESFQFSTKAALRPELLEQLRLTTIEAVSYEFRRSA